MQISKIRPIPKYITALIKAKDLSLYPQQDGHTRYYAYLAKNCGELVKVTVAVKNYKNKWYHRQCAVHGVHSKLCFVKDMGYNYIGGYITGWYYDGASTYKRYYECNEWGWTDDKFFDVYAPVININFINKFPEYKYSAVELMRGTKVLQYLRLYEEYPQIEYLTKAGLHNIAASKTILRRIGTDRQFCKWLLRNKEVLQKNCYYKDVILRAYKSGKDLDELQRVKEFKLKLAHDDGYRRLLKTFDKATVDRIVKYVYKNDISFATYNDYLYACNYLGLDLTEDKNLLPHDFHRWHDIRIDEYRTVKALKDAEERKALYESFSVIAEKYLSLQLNNKGNFICVIAKSPKDLIAEGDFLHHCVGRMGYDQKFIREESLIFFIRTKEQPDVPYVTVEYSPKTHKILQLHGEYNCMPDEAATRFIKRVWLPYANKHLKQIAV